MFENSSGACKGLSEREKLEHVFHKAICRSKPVRLVTMCNYLSSTAENGRSRDAVGPRTASKESGCCSRRKKKEVA